MTKEPAPDDTLVNPVELGDRVRAKRRGRGMSIRELSEETGVSAPTISRVERGHLPDRENLLRLARWAGVRLDPLMHADLLDSRNAAVHEPSASTVEAVELHLRADRSIDREGADALAEMFRVAYEALAGRPRRRTGRKE